MTKLIVTSKYEPKGLTADITVFDGPAQSVNEACAYDFARAMQGRGYYVTITSEITIMDGRKVA